MRTAPTLRKEHIANIEQIGYIVPSVADSTIIAADLSRSRIPAIRSTSYVRHCPAYRRRILHGQDQGPVRRALADRAPVRQGLGDEARQERPLDGCGDHFLGLAG